MDCESCAYYFYDDDIEEYVCDADMDEDDFAHLLSEYKSCPCWRNADEYLVVRHQL